jgi:predicted phosphoribosyltransferase
MPFRDRKDAGRRLARALSGFADDAIILALPRGGVIVAAQIATALDAPLDIVLVRKLGVPGHEELAMGALVDGVAPVVIRNEGVIQMLRLGTDVLHRAKERELAEIERRRYLHCGGAAPPHLSGRTVILVDDGVATGATVRAAIAAIRRQDPRAVILAVPVAPEAAVDDLLALADELVCLETHEEFPSVGSYYDDFRQITDDEVIEALRLHGEGRGEGRKSRSKPAARDILNR